MIIQMLEKKPISVNDILEGNFLNFSTEQKNEEDANEIDLTKIKHDFLVKSLLAENSVMNTQSLEESEVEIWHKQSFLNGFISGLSGLVDSEVENVEN